MKAYKLLTQNLTSHNDTQWELNKTIKIDIPGNEMCSDQVLHYYNHPLLAVLLNPIHANIQNPRLFEIEIDYCINTDGLKFASKSQTLLKELELPVITNEQRAEIAIRVAKLVEKDEKWNSWADKWISSEDRNTSYVMDARLSCSSIAGDASYTAWSSSICPLFSDDNTNYYAAQTIKYTAYVIYDNKEYNEKLINIAEQVIGKYEYNKSNT